MSSTTLPNEAPTPVSVHDLIQGVVHGQPHSIAVSYKDVKLTYTELDAASLRVATRLRKRGIGPGDTVPILTSRCLEMVACVLAIVRIGACWVPMEAESWSRDRINTVLTTVDHKVVIVTEHVDDPIQNAINMEEIRDAMKSPPTNVLESPVGPEDVAYIIFTSGTTSRPKGVIVPHQSLANYVQQGDREAPFNFGARPTDKVILLFSVAFDGEASQNPRWY